MVAGERQEEAGRALPEGDGVSSAFHFMRLQADGRLTAIAASPGFPTLEAAKAAAPELLIRMRPGHRGSRLVLVQVLEDVRFTATVAYDRWPASTRRKHGLAGGGGGSGGGGHCV